MLSAQEEQIGLASDNPEDLPNLGAFGKVVNSIHGLQQRLENLSAEDVGVAHDRTQTLLLSLTDLQRMLTTFVAIKKSMATVRASVEEMLIDYVDLPKLEAIEQPFPIHAVIQANKVVLFPRLNKSPTAWSVPPAPNVGTAEALAIDDNSAEVPPATAPLNQPLQETSLLLRKQYSASCDDTLMATSAEEGSRTVDSLDRAGPHVSAAEELDSVAAVDSIPVRAECRADHYYDSQPPQNATSDAAITPMTVDTVNGTSASTGSTEFDQRLLDDLIKNYGEFAAALNSTRTNERREVVETDSIHPQSKKRIQSDEVALNHDNLPSLKKQGDIDRQLKQIIEDYGEYDLYSRQGPVNLKTGVVAAFLLLGLILSGFYYFSPASSQNPPATPRGNIHSSDAAGPQEEQSAAKQSDTAVGDTGAVGRTDTNSRAKNRK